MSLPRYPEYKESGVEWLGRVPTHWEVKRLKHNLRLLTEKTDRRTNPIALENIESWSGRFVPTETEFQGDGVAFERDDILFGKLRPYLAKVLLAPECGEAVGDFHVMRPSSAIYPRFAQFSMLNRSFINIVDGSTFGSKMPRASWDFVSSIEMATPTLTEQIAIATFLDRETGKINALIDEQEKLLALLAEKRQATISHAVTKGLNLDAPMKDSGEAWLGEVPKHWGFGALSRVAERVVVGIAEAATHAYVEAGTPILRSTNVRPGRLAGEILYIDPEFARERGSKLIRAGDLVTVRTGNAGVTAVVPRALDECQCFTMLITTLLPEHSPDFYCYWMNSEAACRYFGLEGWGTAQVNISVPILKMLPVPIPPQDEQEAIVSFLCSETARLDSLRSEVERAIALLKERRSALISAAVTGQIDVRGLVTEPEAA